MTCIVGLETPNGVIIGGDSAGVSGWSLSVRADTKVFRRDPFIFGFTSSFRMGQLLRYGPLEIRSDWPPEDPDAFMATKFVDAVRKCLKDGGYAKKESEQESAGTFLVGFGARLYAVHSDYQTARSVHGMDAVGCGQDVALGALYVGTDRQPAERVVRALEAAEAWNAGVRRPFHLVST